MRDPGWTALGKSEEILPEIADESIDALICDPPGAISFMGKIWDGDRGGRDQWVPWLTEIMRECYRVMKPGAYGLIWALPRTSHWTAWALEDAGFEIRDKICHVFFSGFPKNHDASKAIDKRLGAEREVIAANKHADRYPNGPGGTGFHGGPGEYSQEGRGPEPLTAPGSPEAEQWNGWGTAMKPAMEEWILVRKPMKLTVAENLLTHGVGALNLGACEIGRAQDDIPGWHQSGAKGSAGFQGSDTFKIHDMTPEEIQARRNGKGRHPSHLIFSHSPDCQEIGEERIKGCPSVVTQGGKDGGGFDPGSSNGTRRDEFQGYGDAEGMETVSVWRCVEGCPVTELNRQSGESKSRKGKPRKSKQAGEGWGMTATGAEYDDFGGKSRFFYCPKPSRSEKQQGLLGIVPCAKCGQLGTKEHVDAQTGNTVPCLLNDHPTPKSVKLLRYFCKLVCPPGGIILDPFMGSGGVGVAAILEGFRFIGIEQNVRSHLISCARLKWAMEQMQ